jgi:hypothetical protein
MSALPRKQTFVGAMESGRVPSDRGKVNGIVEEKGRPGS